MVMSRKIDYIVYVVINLEVVCEELEKVLGVVLVIGGVYEEYGICNVFLNIGEGVYLEIIVKVEGVKF